MTCLSQVTIAARIDSFHENPDGKIGLDMKHEIAAKFEKWQEPPPVKQVSCRRGCHLRDGNTSRGRELQSNIFPLQPSSLKQLLKVNES